MVVGAARYQTEAFIGQGFSKCLSVVHNLLLICFKFRFEGLAKADSLRSDDVLEWTTLGAWEDSLVDLFGKRFFAQDQAASWAAQCLVGGGGDDVGVWNWILMQSSCNQSGNVCHVDKQIGANFMGNLSEFIKADLARISGSAGNDHLRFVFQCQFANLVIVDALGVVQAVWNEVVVGTGDVDRAAVGQMAAVCEV